MKYIQIMVPKKGIIELQYINTERFRIIFLVKGTWAII